MILDGIAGRFVQMASGLLPLSLTGLASVRVAKMEGEGDEATRAGQRFIARSGSGVTPAQLLSPSAQWLLWNPIGNTVTAYLDMVGCVAQTGSPGIGATLWVCPVPTYNAPTTIPTISQASTQIMNCNPASSRASSQVILIDNQTLYDRDKQHWSPIAFVNPFSNIVLQAMLENRDLRGKLCLPPGCGMAFLLTAPSGALTWGLYAMWREYASDNE